MSSPTSEFLRHAPCEACDSSDALAVYSDGHGHCFSCGVHVASVSAEGSPTDTSDIPPRIAAGGNFVDGLEFRSLPTRSLSEATCHKWAYGVATVSGHPVQVACYFDRATGRTLVAQKVRGRNKEFHIRGSMKDAGLYGQHLWSGKGRMVVVTEGEIDALSVSQAQDNKWPVVSVPNGAQGARKAIAANLEWLLGYDHVVLMFDNDEPGNAAAVEVAEFLPPGRCKIAKLSRKDANEHLVAGEAHLIRQAIWDAKEYRPDGILGVDDLREMVEAPVPQGLSYPWPELTEVTYGIRQNELITIGAGTGVGKTEFLKELVLHLVSTHEQKVGLLFLEEAPRDTALAIMGKQANIRFHLPDAVYTAEDKQRAFDATIGTGRLCIYDHFGHVDYDTIVGKMRYMVQVEGCRYVFLDHVTALVSGSTNEERKELDRIMTGLASLVRELEFTLIMVSHLATPEGRPHEEGGRVQIRHFRGSRAIGQWSSIMFGLERNQQADDPDERSVTTLRVLKDRFSGRAVGFRLLLRYADSTGRLEVCERQEDHPFTDEAGEF